MNCLTTLGSFFPYTLIETQQVIEATDKVYRMAMRYFTLSQSLFFCGYGVKEMSVDAQKLQPHSTPLDKALESPKHMGNFSLIHGLFFMCTGACGIGLSAQQVAVQDFAPYSWQLDRGCKLFFGLANLVALDYNINIFLRTLEFGDSPEEQQAARRLQASSIPGILSSLSYLLATAWTMFGGATAIALVIGVIGACFGTFKILYDFFLLHKTTTSL